MIYFNYAFLTHMFRPLLRPSSGWNFYCWWEMCD